MKKIELQLPAGTDAVILATRHGHGLVPHLLRQPQQICADTLAVLAEHSSAALVAIPVRSCEYIELPGPCGGTGRGEVK